ncbi:MAG: HAD family hydrolase [Candidatus Omnitrophica bacterium]|jgi:phosphoglycolate phosphatase|nr:HAD family hydrolase [Candidatus Omnitrophota bacterium]
MIEKKFFIFDLDGTLADAYRAIEKSLNFTLNKLGFSKVSYKEAKQKVGRGDKIFMETFFPPEAIKQALGIYRRHHKGALRMFSKLRPHARWMLKQLKRKGKLTAIASNRPSYFTNLILTTLGIKKYFNMVLCADEVRSNKPNPKILNVLIKKLNVARGETVFIGDMDIDLETAKRANIDVVFIKGGSSRPAVAGKYKNAKVISSLKEILKLYE